MEDSKPGDAFGTIAGYCCRAWTMTVSEVHSATTISCGPLQAANMPFALRAYTPEKLRDVLRKLYPIRKFEEGADDCYTRGPIHSTMHLSIGQGASALGICMPLSVHDQITSTHRGHGHFIAKGATVDRMFTEFFGKTAVYCKGRCGSMHIADVTMGNLCANGIVAGRIPIVVGAGLSAKMQKNGRFVVCFFGDNANNEGAFHEALNVASIWKSPVVFVFENKGYGMSTSTGRSTAVANIAERAVSYPMPGVIVNGNDIHVLLTDGFIRYANKARHSTVFQRIFDQHTMNMAF